MIKCVKGRLFGMEREKKRINIMQPGKRLQIINGNLSLGFLLEAWSRQFPKMLSSWKQYWLSYTHTHTHGCTHSWTFITLELSTHILPWVISFRLVSSAETSYWKCICLSCVSEESAYLMLTSWDLACKQTWRPPVRLKITTRSHGWVKEETGRKEGRCRERKEKKDVKGGGGEMMKKPVYFLEWS